MRDLACRVHLQLAVSDLVGRWQLARGAFDDCIPDGCLAPDRPVLPLVRGTSKAPFYCATEPIIRVGGKDGAEIGRSPPTRLARAS